MSTFPISEIFDSIQGEGHWVGTPMHFVRLAGCNVGKNMKTTIPREPVCTTCFGTKFFCDTDYVTIEKRLTAEELIIEMCRAVPDVISITGGEPFIHPLEEVVPHHVLRRKRVHIETSGTIEVPTWVKEVALLASNFWICLSPKIEFLPEWLPIASEVKFLVSVVDVSIVTKIENMVHLYDIPDEKVFLQPINGGETIDSENLEYAINILKHKHPEWRLSAQCHKDWRVR